MSRGDPSAALEFSGARLHVHLGWGVSERAVAQAVDLGVRVEFARLPGACRTDELTDTLCYADLIERARGLCGQRAFRLLEHLAWALAEELRPCVPEDARLELTVTKLHPPVRELHGGVSFRLVV